MFLLFFTEKYNVYPIYKVVTYTKNVWLVFELFLKKSYHLPIYITKKTLL